MRRVVVIGGGAAGMMAALTAAEKNTAAHVTLLEKNEKLGKKIYITGKGRCNFTNACDFNTFISNVVTNPKFMYSSLRAFAPEDMIEFLEESGCPTKVERGNRAFPESDHASDVTAALARRMKAAGVEVKLETEVLGIEQIDAANASGADQSTDTANVNTADPVSGNVNAADPVSAAGVSPRFRILTKDRKTGRKQIRKADAVIIATGGLSYPSTGSTGDGYRFAEEFGFVGCTVLLSIYALLIWRCVLVFRHMKERFGRILAIGITLMLGIQVFLNVGVVTGMIPATGLPLPFISAGGTSLTIFLAEIGVLLNISKQSGAHKRPVRKAAKQE